MANSEKLPDEFYHSIFKDTAIGLGITDEDGNLVDFNDAILRPGGYLREDLEGKNVIEFCYDTKERDAIVAMLRMQGFVERVAARFRRKDGTPYYVKMSLHPVIVDGLKYIQATVEDATAIWENEQRAEMNQKIMDIVQRAASVGFWYSDPAQEGRLIWTEGTYRIFGFTHEQFDGKVETFFKAIHPEDAEYVSQASKDALAGKKPYDVTHRIIRPDGKIRWVRQQAEVLFDEKGKAFQMVGITYDITDVKVGAKKVTKKVTKKK